MANQNLLVSNVEDLGSGQFRCTVTVLGASGAPAAVHEGYNVASHARVGIGPAVWAVLQAGEFEGTIKPFIAPAE